MKNSLTILFCFLAATLLGQSYHGTFTGAGTISNSMFAPAPFVILHTNKTVSVVTGTATNVLSFQSSKTAGMNEIQSLFTTKSNSPFAGFTVQLDPGVYHITSQIVISNNCRIVGAGPSATILRYVGSTNFATLADMTNALTILGPSALMNADKVGLMLIATNTVLQAGIEPVMAYNVELSGFTIQTSTNMYCAGIVIEGGDHTLLDNVFVAGPELWTTPSYYAGFMDANVIPEPSKMVGMIIGGNQPRLNHCRVFAVANGIVLLGNSFTTIDDLNLVSLDYVGHDGATPFPAASELSLSSGILIPKSSQCAVLSVKHVLFFDVFRDVYIGNQSSLINIEEFKDQNSPFIADNISIWWGAGSYPIVNIKNSADVIVTSAITNDAVSGFYVNNSATAYIAQQTSSVGGQSFWDGTSTTFASDRNGMQFMGTVNNDVRLASGKKFIGDGFAVTNVQGSNVVGSLSFHGFTNAPIQPIGLDNNTNAWTFSLFDSITNLPVVESGTMYGFPLGTNTFVSLGASTVGFNGVLNVPTSSERYGTWTFIATGTLVVTNPPEWFTSDMLTSRTCTNGNTMAISVDVIPGHATNMALVQMHHQ